LKYESESASQPSCDTEQGKSLGLVLLGGTRLRR
jgi:hypothetical protein